MASLTCPLCPDSFESESNLRVHLEVEHRKSEIVDHLVATSTRRTDPVIESDEGPDRQLEDPPSPV